MIAEMLLVSSSWHGAGKTGQSFHEALHRGISRSIPHSRGLSHQRALGRGVLLLKRKSLSSLVG